MLPRPPRSTRVRSSAASDVYKRQGFGPIHAGRPGHPAILPAGVFLRQHHQLHRVDNWRFWIIHLWVEGFFELLVTTMVAVTFFLLGVVSRQTAARVVYLDAI